MENRNHYNQGYVSGIKYLIVTSPTAINILLPCLIIVAMNISWLQVFTLTCKELRSFQSIWTTSWTNWKYQQFLDLLEKQSHKANCCSQNWKYRQADTENHNLLEQKPTSRIIIAIDIVVLKYFYIQHVGLDCQNCHIHQNQGSYLVSIFAP